MKNIIQQLKNKLTVHISWLHKKPAESVRLEKLKRHIAHSLISLDKFEKILDSHSKTGTQV